MNVVKSLKGVVDKHGSTLCVVGVMVGLGLTIYETWKARPKVDKIMDEYHDAVKDIQADDTKSEEEKKKAVNGEKVDVAKKTAVTVAKVATCAVATGGLAVAGHVMDARKIANMAATIEMGDLAYRKLDQKLTEVLGEEKAKEVKEEIKEESAREAVERALNSDGEFSIIDQGIGGSQVYYVPDFNCLFRSDDHTISEVCHKLNERMGCKAFDEPYISYDEFFDEMGVSVPMLAYHFIFDKDTLLKPNLNNAIKIGDISCIVLDWYDEPKCAIK